MSYDNNRMKYIGWEASENGRFTYANLFEEHHLLFLQKKITQLLMGVAPNNQPIVVTFDVIGNVMSSVVESQRPQVGDIYSRYQLSSIEFQRNDIKEIVDRTINIIITQIRNEYEMADNNKKLTVWNTLYGDFNKEGLRAHAPIKIRKKRSDRMQFNMNY